MSDFIPFDIQSQIMKSLPVKSLLQFRSVSKQWKASIDSPKFIKNYHVNHTNPQHHLLVMYKLDNVIIYTSIVDNHTFPQQKFPLTAPESLSSLRLTETLTSADGLLFFYGHACLGTKMAIIWNPTLRKSVCIAIPIPKSGYIKAVGFGVCPYTSDPKLVKIGVDKISSMWMVEVFMLSTRVWKTVYVGVPYKSGDFCTMFQVFVNGVIYFCACAYDAGVRSNFVKSFDLKSEKFGEVCVPDKLLHTPRLDVAKVNESLGLLDHYDEGDITVCDVWTREDGANKAFSKLYTVKVEGKWLFTSILGFRNNGEVVITVVDDYHEEYGIEVYEPLSGHTNSVGIYGKTRIFMARPYTETLILLDQPDSIIH